MSDEKPLEPCRIIIEYDPGNGAFSLSANVGDEIITTGMLQMADRKMKENYRLQDMRRLKQEADTAIIPVSGGLKVQ